jgi:hypothetical protein
MKRIFAVRVPYSNLIPQDDGKVGPVTLKEIGAEKLLYEVL